LTAGSKLYDGGKNGVGSLGEVVKEETAAATPDLKLGGAALKGELLGKENSLRLGHHQEPVMEIGPEQMLIIPQALFMQT